jgi:peptide/nickel transport system substrate-binding protein
MRLHRLIDLKAADRLGSMAVTALKSLSCEQFLLKSVWWAVLILAGLVAACSELPADHIRFGLATAPVTLDPRYATDAVSYRISRLIYRSLVEFDAAFRPVPALASWQQITPTCYRFRLGTAGRLFHDGTHLTASDVKATYESVLDTHNASPHRGSLTVIQRIESPDRDTVDFFLHKPDPLFPGRLVIGILPAHLIARGHPFNKAPVGSGPFRFWHWPNEAELQLERWIDKQLVEFITVADPTVRVLKLLRGEIDLLQGDLPPEMIRWLEARPTIQVQKGRGDTFAYLGFNLDDPVAGRLPIRQAIAYALDRQAIIHSILGGTARKASTLFPPDHWAGHPRAYKYDYNLDKARRLLRDAGYTAPLRISYKTSNNPFRVRLATVIQHQLKQAGIEVQIQSYDWGTFYADIRAGRFQMYSLGWVGVKLPDIFRYALHSDSVPPQGANRGRFKSPVVDSLIEQAEATADLDAQAALYRELQSELLRELPYVPLWYEDNVLVAQSRIQGYVLAADGNYDGLIHTDRRE